MRALDTREQTTEGSAFEVFKVFLVRGLTSFGGPVAHLGYYHEAFVKRRGWLSDAAYADLIALCQFLPGPASSQVGMAIGLMRAGYLGMLAAFVGFTLPSALLMYAFAEAFGFLSPLIGSGWIAGLKAAAVAVVAFALLGMARNLTPDLRRLVIAAGAAALVLVAHTPWTQLAAILIGAVLGLWLVPNEAVEAREAEAAADTKVGRRLGVAAFGVFIVLLLIAFTLRGTPTGLGLAAHFYHAGALVFGGGHVVLPLLETEVVSSGLVSRDAFLAGYGAAQALPGPLFAFSAYLGSLAQTPLAGALGGLVALLAIFLPGALLVIAALPFWRELQHAPNARKALAGVNAAVVGILAAALYDPVFKAGVDSLDSTAIAASAFLALAGLRVPAWGVVIVAAGVGAVIL
ncbi:chromate transporter [Rhodopseudomonas julia]|uniref:Chromate transporter n=1 Tax=Rhodopseudomonas julia TaxID=200617 RepID=A0ABU0CAF2_9BRAD|nr:chromate efflux transporter [Rhodopseudomonas julia]MDQ0327513.1 chromate transporter [Rhodopseudomonas julia]